MCIRGSVYILFLKKTELVPFLSFGQLQMHALGIYSRLDEVFDAPLVVKEVLISQFGLDKSV